MEMLLENMLFCLLSFNLNVLSARFADSIWTGLLVDVSDSFVKSTMLWLSSLKAWKYFLTSCLEKLGMAIHEIVFATRNKFENSSILSAMENTAKSLGIEYNEKALKRVDWTKKICKNL